MLRDLAVATGRANNVTTVLASADELFVPSGLEANPGELLRYLKENTIHHELIDLPAEGVAKAFDRLQWIRCECITF